MMDFSRRDFLGSAALLFAATAVPFAHARAAAAKKPPAPLSHGKIHIIGLNEPPGIKPAGRIVPQSMLTTIDLKTGQTLATEIPITEGHGVLPLGDGMLVCVSHHSTHSCVVDADHSTIEHFKAPDGYLFGGHALVLPDRKAFVIPARRRNQKGQSDLGKFLVYDSQSLTLLDEIDAAALHPHEMRAIPQTNEIAVTHYGDIEAAHPYYMHNAVAPKLVIYDAATLKEKRSFAQDSYDAMLTHMSVSPDGHAWCVLTQYYNIKIDPAQSMEEQKRSAAAQIREATGKDPDFSIIDQGLREGRVAMPLPFLKIDTKTGKTEPIMPVPDDYIRSQSVACNLQTGASAATYFFSDTLVVDRPGQEMAVLSGKDIGITGIRGVAEVPDTSLFVVSGSAAGAVIIDSLTFEVIAHFDVDTAHAPHVEFERT